MKDEEQLDDLDLVVGGVKIGEHLKSSAASSKRAEIFSIIAAIASVLSLVVAIIMMFQ